MCFTIDKYKFTGIKVAERAFKTYKVLSVKEGKLKPLSYGDTTYEIGKPNEEVELVPYERKINSSEVIFINAGYYSIRNLKNAEKFFVSNLTTYEYNYTDTHTYDTILVECTIPKGAKYAVDRKGFIVSSNIIVNKRIPRFIVNGNGTSTGSALIFSSYAKALDDYKRRLNLYKGYTIVSEEDTDDYKYSLLARVPWIGATVYILKR